MESLDKLISILEKSLSDSNCDCDATNLTAQVKNIENKIQIFEDEGEFVKFGYYKYILAELCISSERLEEKKKFANHLKLYYQDYYEYLLNHDFSNLNNTTDDFNDIEKTEQYQNLLQQAKKKHFLIIGFTGVGKSSFVKKITKDSNIQTSNSSESHTQNCSTFEIKGMKFIDSPGINDTKKTREKTLLTIVKYLHDSELKVDDLFIILVQNDQFNSFTAIKEFSYTYFLYELFKENLKPEEVKQFYKEYLQSNNLLDWKSCNFDQTNLNEQRQLIFSEKDKAQNYLQYFNDYHIQVETFFDFEFQKFDYFRIQYLKTQIWSDKAENTDFGIYNKYIKNQESHLLDKIDKIIKIEIKNKLWKRYQDHQNILLIGKSQVGKSSLIEQLTNIKGIRGSGSLSTTSLCKFYCVDYENVVYRFIDTPGFDGDEHQYNLNCFKVIADFLNRNQIKEFKILFMQDPKNIKNTSQQVLKEFFIFIKDIFGQDVSFINQNSFSENSFESVDSDLWKDFLKEKILYVFRDTQIKNKEEINQQFNYQLFKVWFQSSYFNNLKVILVEKEYDKNQKNRLFENINKINSVTIDDKVILKMKQALNSQLIKTIEEYKQKLVEMKQKYTQLEQLKNDIQQVQNTEEITTNKLKNQLLQLFKTIDSSLFRVLDSLNKQINVEEIVQPISNDMLNDILKHFLFIYSDPVLFERNLDQPQHTLISKKQNYYCVLSHQLSRFTSNRNQYHIQQLEMLAEIKVLEEISFQYILQQRYFETHYNQKAQENVEGIQSLFSGLNIIFRSGIQIFRQATYFSQIAERKMVTAALSRLWNLSYFWANCILAAISIGIDAYQLSKGFISSEEYKLTTRFNIVSGIFSLAAILIPGVGWTVLGATGGLSLIGYGISALQFTSRTIFDETIAKSFQKIMEDTKPNQSLKYFEISKFLKEKNIKNYSELNQKDAYELFREIEINNFDNPEQKSALTQLFENERPKNLISQYVTEQFILTQFHLDYYIQQENEDNIKFLQRSIALCKSNKDILGIYFNRNIESILKEIQQAYEKAKSILISKLSSEEKKQKKQTQSLSMQVRFEQQEQDILNNYSQLLQTFCEQIEIKKHTYEEQEEFSNGYFRKLNRYPTLFSSYCNLMQQKIEYKYKNQPIITELEKDPNKKQFIIQCGSEDNIFKKRSDQVFEKQIILLRAINDYTTNRYFQQLEGQEKSNLTCIAKDEIMSSKVKFSLDLHDIFEESDTIQKFIDNIEYKSQQKIGKFSDISKRITEFYESVKYLNNHFQQQV